MEKSISERNKRALLILSVAAVLILAFQYMVGPWLDEWNKVRVKIGSLEERLTSIESAGKTADEKIKAFEMPQSEDLQRLLFYRKMTEQLQKAGIGVNPLPLYVSRGQKQPALGLKLLRLRCQGKGKCDKILGLLASLEENPYLVGIDEFKIVCGEKKRDEMQLDLTVSTYVR